MNVFGIIGLRKQCKKPKYIYNDGIARTVQNINPYLVPGKNIFVHKKREPLSQIPKCNFGSMPNDGGHLILSSEENQSLRAEYPDSVKFIKAMSGTDEFIDGTRRFCLWIEDAEIADALKIPTIKKRVDQVYEHRFNSPRAATNKLASVPHRFGEVRHTNSDSILIPSVSSEKREYIPSGLVSKNVVISNLAFAIPNAPIWILGVISSKIHLVWVKAVSGGLETRIRYSSGISYNNFPFPSLDENKQQELEALAERILIEREAYPEKSIAWLYDPNTMPDSLLLAHQKLDEAVERCYRTKPFNSDEERLEHLFKLYEKMTEIES